MHLRNGQVTNLVFLGGRTRNSGLETCQVFIQDRAATYPDPNAILPKYHPPHTCQTVFVAVERGTVGKNKNPGC